MSDIQISLCASANRPLVQGHFHNWERFINSLKENKINWEVIFVGDTPPPYEMPTNFHWIRATVKPAQCYEIAFRASKGELIHWTADDADYFAPKYSCVNSLDIAYNYWQEMEKKYNNDRKTITAMRPIEGGNPDVQEGWHYFFGGCPWSPRMAPFGLIDRNFFLKDIGGYHREFVSGQSENSTIMDALERGGRVEFCREAFLYVHHHQVHPRKPGTNREDNKFRDWYNWDRKVLETIWVKEGYGSYEKLNSDQLREKVTISNKRLVQFIPFEEREDWLTVTQGAKGIW